MTYVTFKTLDTNYLGEKIESSLAVRVDLIFAVQNISKPEYFDGNKTTIFTLTNGEPYSFHVAADVTEVLATIELADPTKLVVTPVNTAGEL